MKKDYYKFKYWFYMITGWNIMLSVEQERELEYKAGYIGKDGQPLVCYNCGHKKFKMGQHWSEEGYGLVEYEELCCKCNKRVGHWAYGYWRE